MKKISLLLALAGVVGTAHAGVIDWASGAIQDELPSSIGNGAVVALYQDVDGDNASGWQTTAGALKVNTDLSVAGGSLGMQNDIFLGQTTYLIEDGDGYKYLNQVQGIDLSDGTDIYTVIFESTADGGKGLVIDMEARSVGSLDLVGADGNKIYYADEYVVDGNKTYGNVAGTLGGVAVIPEPATFGLFGFFSVAIFWIRRRTKR